MPDAIDQIVIACSDPDAAADEIQARLGLRATGAGRRTAVGTFNRLIWLGDTFIELIGVEARKLAEASWIGRPVLAAADAGGGFATGRPSRAGSLLRSPTCEARAPRSRSPERASGSGPTAGSSAGRWPWPSHSVRSSRRS